ncbi:hypothetical protein GF406_14740 [candidate division KSB1 bacterium]|nr:hypothetical protein [candidate division KSB1 bacterium]
MKRCQRCILPETYPGISFDEHHICNRCHSWDVEYSKVDYRLLKKELDQLIEKKKEQAQKHGCPYDIIVPVSGGKDSAFVLYVMTKQYHCNVLAINYNNLFQTELARNNLQTLIDHFDVPFLSVSLKPSLLKKAYKAGLERQKEFCLVCNCTGYWLLLHTLTHYFLPYNYQPLVIGGWSKLFEFDPQINTLDIKKYFDLLKTSDLLKEFTTYLDIRALEALMENQDVRTADTLQYIQLPDYMEWNHTKIVHLLEKEGWQREKETDTHFDCWASPIADWLEKQKYGLNQKTTTIASQVRAGLLSRETALELESRSPEMDEHFDRFCDFLSISKKTLKR